MEAWEKDSIVVCVHYVGTGLTELKPSTDKALEEEEILESILEDHTSSKESSDDDEGGLIVTDSIPKCLQLANGLMDDFTTLNELFCINLI
ncbi:hypothetical protein NPIL_553911 [Nephila pilipes]|uniref:Uncharacterized protein n=1 Tax=Nephila pilipes TaxID=299642 RepID=A0A8X6TJ30_NEPPI|nr:hypothetical protein NPIL_553911 [Nephila pilipes]